MWGKVEQTILWTVTYSPLVAIMVLRFISSNDFLNIDDYRVIVFDKAIWINSMIIEVIFVLIILLISFALYKLTINYLLSGYEKNLKPGNEGKNFSIRKINYLSVNDYSFFLLTLLLPIISLDHSSIINLVVSIVIIICVIAIYVKTDSISSCPLFFFSGRKIYKGIISQGTKEEETINPFLRKEVIIILKQENLTLNNQMRGGELVKNVYYLTSIK